MAKQTKPSDEEMEKYSELASIAFTRMTGSKVDVRLDYFPFPEPVYVTKSRVFGAHTQVVESASSVSIPSKLILKQYIQGVERTSNGGALRESVEEEYRKERAILDLDIHINGANGEKIRVYPILYSKDVPECEKEMIILREFISDKTLEKLAEEQLANGEIKWEAAGTPAISDSLYPIALLHTQSPVVAKTLKERGLLKFGTPDTATNSQIAENRSKRFVRYVSILVDGMGKELSLSDAELLKENYAELDKEFVSNRDFLCIVDGELDVFPHHAMRKRIPDAGGVEIGGFVRDLALYSAPSFNDLWGGLENMPKKVREAYFGLRRQFEESLRYPSKEFDPTRIDLGIFLASFFGNMRKSAAVLHYNGADEGYPVEQEAKRYLANSSGAFNIFTSEIGILSYHARAKFIHEVLLKYGEMNENYELKRIA